MIRNLSGGASWVYRLTRAHFQETESRHGFPNPWRPGNSLEYDDFTFPAGRRPSLRVSVFCRPAVYRPRHADSHDPRPEALALDGATLLRVDRSVREWRGDFQPFSGGAPRWLRQDNGAGNGALYAVGMPFPVRAPASALSPSAPGFPYVPAGTVTALYSTSTDLLVLDGPDPPLTSAYTLTVTGGPESVTVPAGTFADCYPCDFREPLHGFNLDGAIPGMVGMVGDRCAVYATGRLWFSPAVGAFVKMHWGKRYEDDATDKAFGHMAYVWEMEAYS